MKTFIPLQPPQLKSHIIAFAGSGLWGGSVFLQLIESGQGEAFIPPGCRQSPEHDPNSLVILAFIPHRTQIPHLGNPKPGGRGQRSGQQKKTLFVG